MKLAKRTEVELRDSLHDAIDRMSVMEIVVLIFLVQLIRTREFVSHILPRPRKALPAPVEEYEIDWDEVGTGYLDAQIAAGRAGRTDPEPAAKFPGLDAQVATGCTDPEPECDLESDLSSAISEISRILQEANHPVLQEPTEAEWNRVYRGAPPYFSPPIPMPSPMYTRDDYGRPRVADIQPVEPYLDGGFRVNRNAGNYLGEMSGYCTPSRSHLTGYDATGNRCNCPACTNMRNESRAMYEACGGS